MGFEDYLPYDADPSDCFGSGDQDVQLKYDSLGRETAQAWLVRFELGKDLQWVEAWMPKSQCSLGSGNTIWAPQWLVTEKNLEAYEK